MKSLFLKLALAFVASSALAGCGGVAAVMGPTALVGVGGFTVSKYGASVKNVIAVKNSGITPVAVSNFTFATPGLSTISCRSLSFVETPDKSSFESYIQKAITDELKLAGLYDPASTIVLQGNIERLELNSILSAGKWVISLNLASNKYSGYTTIVTYESPTNLIGDIACQQMAKAFFPAIQDLLNKTVSDPRFKQLSM